MDLQNLKNTYAQEQGYADWANLYRRAGHYDETEFFKHENAVFILAQEAALEKYFEWHKSQGYISHKPSDIQEFITNPEFIKLFEGEEGEKLYRPMTEFPPITEGEQHSKMVLVFDEDLDDCDFGFYDFELQKWVVMGDFQMNLICWRHVEKPMYEDVQEYPTVLTD